MPRVGFEPTISAGERPKTYALDRAATGTGNSFILQQCVCYTTILNMFRAACCSKHVEDRSVIYLLLKNKRIVH